MSWTGSIRLYVATLRTNAAMPAILGLGIGRVGRAAAYLAYSSGLAQKRVYSKVSIPAS